MFPAGSNNLTIHDLQNHDVGRLSLVPVIDQISQDMISIGSSFIAFPRCLVSSLFDLTQCLGVILNGLLVHSPESTTLPGQQSRPVRSDHVQQQGSESAAGDDEGHG